MKIRISLLLALLFISPLLAQTGGTLEVTSDPSGTTISLEGELRLAGVTPTVFSQPLNGKYTLKAARDGYESYETDLVLTGGSPLKVNIKLAPKTRFKAFLRSAVVPGWGQYYSGEKTRGVFFGTVTLASGIVSLISQIDFEDKRDKYDEILAEFSKERSIEKKEEMESLVEEARQDAYDAETFRNISVGVLAAVWTYNLLDAVLFFPDRRYDSSIPRVSVDTDRDLSRVALTFKFSF